MLVWVICSLHHSDVWIAFDKPDVFGHFHLHSSFVVDKTSSALCKLNLKINLTESTLISQRTWFDILAFWQFSYWSSIRYDRILAFGYSYNWIQLTKQKQIFVLLTLPKISKVQLINPKPVKNNNLCERATIKIIYCWSSGGYSNQLELYATSPMNEIRLVIEEAK